MRNFVAFVGFLFLAAFLMGCGDSNGNNRLPAANFTGRWASANAGPGSLTMNLTANGAFVAGTGTFVNAAGTTLPVQVTGSVNRDTYNLDLQPTQTQPTVVTGVYHGTIVNTNTLSGVVQFAGAPDVNVTVIRQ